MNKIIDLLQFRESSDHDSETDQPAVTTGSVVWGVLLRSAIIITASLFVLNKFQLREHWWVIVFLLWFLVLYPAYRQYQSYDKRIKEMQEETLCGSCKHFESSSQLCRIYDRHVSKNHIPCEGLNWEPTGYEEEEY